MCRHILEMTGPALQRCCLLAEDAGAERMFPQGSAFAFLSGIFSLTVRLYCASISRSLWSSSGVRRRSLGDRVMGGIELLVLPLPLPLPSWEKASTVSTIRMAEAGISFRNMV